jgi:hypothetical protein
LLEDPEQNSKPNETADSDNWMVPFDGSVLAYRHSCLGPFSIAVVDLSPPALNWHNRRSDVRFSSSHPVSARPVAGLQRINWNPAVQRTVAPNWLLPRL